MCLECAYPYIPVVIHPQEPTAGQENIFRAGDLIIADFKDGQGASVCWDGTDKDGLAFVVGMGGKSGGCGLPVLIAAYDG
jgi:hypothetical protein